MEPDNSPYTLRAAIRRQRWFLLALTGIPVALLAAWAGQVPFAGVLLGVECLLLGVARLAVPARLLGGIAVRERKLDAALYFSLSAALIALALTAPNL
ncbi:DUF3017 domain-containing protein [Dermabacteraceae bacterium TAE3-ERU27]|nr:DUF3017 domain-containing protein [Dermabacteraceae bacterium TAE3-ERU27]